MLAKGTRLLTFTYRLGGSELVSVIRGATRSNVARRLFKMFCYDWHRNIEVRAYPSGEVLYNGSVGCIDF